MLLEELEPNGLYHALILRSLTTRIKHISDFYIQFCIIVCRMSETNCHIDCEKQTQFMHVKLLVKKPIQLQFVVIHIHFHTTFITKSKSSILVVKNKTIHTLFLHNLFIYICVYSILERTYITIWYSTRILICLQ